MSTSSGFPQFPAGPKPPGQAIPADSSRETTARINDITGDLRDIPQRTRIKGKVVAINRDNSVRIRTARGDVDVQPAKPADLQNLKPGDEVELDIPAGRPPQNLRIETPPERLVRQPPPDIRQSATPVDVRVTMPDAPPQPEAPAQAIRPADLPGQTVRVESISPEQVQALLSRPPEQIQDVIIPRALWQALTKTDAIVRNAQIDIADTVLNIRTPLPVTEALAQNPVIETPSNIAVQPLAANIAGQNPLPFVETLKPPALQPPLTTPEFGALATTLQTIPAPITTIQQPVLPANAFLQNTLLTAINGTPVESKAIQNLPLQIQTIETLPNPLLLPIKANGQTILDARTGFIPSAIETQISDQPIKQMPLILGAQKAGEIAAQVIAQTPQKLPVIGFFSAPTQSFEFLVLHTPAQAIPTGASLSLIPQMSYQGAVQISSAPSSSLPLPAPLYFLNPEPWPMMQDLANALMSAAPRAAHALANMTPSPANPAQLGPTALFFIAAIRGGDLTQWMGDKALDALRKAGRGGLLTRIGQEGANLARLANEPVTQDWKAISLPLQWEGEYQKIVLYYKRDDSNADPDQHGGKQTRFIFDLSLDRIGLVQLDGLFRGSRLDLIVRTQTHFTEAMQMDMRRMYTGALAQTQITGELSFQNQIEQWVKIKPTNHQLGIST